MPYFLNASIAFTKEAIAFKEDLMGNLQYILPKMQWLLFQKSVEILVLVYYEKSRFY